MSRIELHCPSCGYDVLPTLMPPPKQFTCPGCNETMPRNKLTRLKVLHRNIAGAQSEPLSNMTAVVLGTNTFFDPTQATGSITVSNCVFQTGDICVVCVGDNLVGNSGGPGACTVGGLGCTPITNQSFNDESAVMLFRANVGSGSKSIVCSSWAANPTACSAVVLALRGGRTASPLDQSSSAAAFGAAFDTASTPGQSATGDFAVAVVAVEGSNADGASVWAQGYNFVQRSGTASGGPPNDTYLDVATKKLSDTSPTHATGTIATSTTWAALVATFKQA